MSPAVRKCLAASLLAVLLGVLSPGLAQAQPVRLSHENGRNASPMMLIRGPLALLQDLILVIWANNGGRLDPNGGKPASDNGGQLDPDGGIATSDNGGQLDPNG